MDQTKAEQSSLNRRLLNIVMMEKLSSIEYYLDESGPRQVLQSITIDIKKGEVWAITGNNTFELKLLLEIMGNIKPYKNGKCALLERGMFRRKRTALPQMFYFGDTDMVYRNMNVLEFLMFATANKNFDVVSQQERIFEQLITFGLGDISLTPIYTLPSVYRALILLLVGLYSSNQLIILNLPTLVYDDYLRPAFKKITEYMKSQEQTVVISTQDINFIEQVCDHTAVLCNGRFSYSGTTKEFLAKTLILQSYVNSQTH